MPLALKGVDQILPMKTFTLHKGTVELSVGQPAFFASAAELKKAISDLM